MMLRRPVEPKLDAAIGVLALHRHQPAGDDEFGMQRLAHRPAKSAQSASRALREAERQVEIVNTASEAAAAS